MSTPAPSPASKCWDVFGLNLPLIFPKGFLPFLDGILPCAWEQWGSIGAIILCCCCCILILMSGGGGTTKGGGGGAGGGGQVVVIK